MFVVLNDFSDDEVEKLLGEFRVQIGLFRQIFEPRDLGRFAGRIGRGKVVFGFEFPHGLSVFEPLAQRIDEDRIKGVAVSHSVHRAYTARAAPRCGVAECAMRTDAVILSRVIPD